MALLSPTMNCMALVSFCMQWADGQTNHGKGDNKAKEEVAVFWNAQGKGETTPQGEGEAVDNGLGEILFVDESGMTGVPRVNNARRGGHFVASTAVFASPEKIINVAGEGASVVVKGVVWEQGQVIIVVIDIVVVVALVAGLITNCITGW